MTLTASCLFCDNQATVIAGLAPVCADCYILNGEPTKAVHCTRCELGWAHAPESIEGDPICRDCAKEIAAQQAKGCPGYGDEDCGGPTLPGSDLCGDCHMARCDIESPRIPR